MSTFNTTNIESTSGGAPNFSQGLNVGGSAIGTLITMTEYYSQAGEPSSPANGAVWWDGTDAYQYVGGKWRILSLTPPPAWGDRAVFAGGFSTSTDTQYISITTPSNSTSFGSLSVGRYSGGMASDGSRGVYAGGYDWSNLRNTIDYVTIATPSNATDFGDLSRATMSVAGCSDPTYGLFAGGSDGVASNVIEYVTIATTGNASDFGDLTVARRLGDSGASNQTYGLFSGGRNSSYADVNVIDYVTIATPSNATDFGDLLGASLAVSSTSNINRAVFADTGNATNTISYVTPSTPSNATDFGDLTVGRSFTACTTDGTYATFIGGNSNVIDRVTIGTLGNATDFGDTIGTYAYYYAACSGD